MVEARLVAGASAEIGLADLGAGDVEGERHVERHRPRADDGIGGRGAGNEEARAEADLAERAAGLGGAIPAIGAQLEPAGADEALDARLAEHLLLVEGRVVEDDFGALAGTG